MSTLNDKVTLSEFPSPSIFMSEGGWGQPPTHKWLLLNIEGSNYRMREDEKYRNINMEDI